MSSNESRRRSLSSTIVPAALGSRRGSLASTSAKSVKDKDALTQALDQLHTTASRSAELTAFPPPPSSAVEERGRPGPSGGLGGIYNRIKATVSGNTDTGGKSPSRPGSADSRDASKRRSKPAPLKQSDVSNDNHDRSPSNVRSSLVSPSLSTSFMSIGRASIDGMDTAPTQASTNAPAPLLAITSQSASTSEPLPSLSLQLSRQESRSASGQDGPKAHTATRGASSRRSDVAILSPDDVLEPSSHAMQSGNVVTSTIRSPSKAIPVTVPPDNGASPSTRMRYPSVSTHSHRREDSRSSAVHSDREQEREAILARAAEDVVRQTEPAQSAPPKATQTAAKPVKAYKELTKPVLNIETKPSRKPPNSSFMHQMRRKILSRDFWMRDENAKICFGCGDSFSTFRRKHHCRLCGQIFCSSCTKLVSGKAFGQTSKIRVCKTCETMMNGDDSSDYTEDEDTPMPPQVKQIRFSEAPRTGSDASSVKQADNDTDGEKPATPSSSSSAFRRSRDGRRRSVQLDRVPTLSRPVSSRSLKSITGRPRSSSQKTRRPHTQHMRSLGVSVDSGVPFQPAVNTAESSAPQLPVFHTDSVIDPELAPFMSDDDTSEDETPNIASAFSSDFTDQHNGFPTSIFGALRRARSYGPTKLNTEINRANRDGDNDSIDSARPARIRRHIGSRSVSVASISLQSASPRVSKVDSFLASSDNLHAAALRGALAFDDINHHSRQDKSLRRASVPDAGLTQAGLDHVKKMLRQFLRDIQIDRVKQWEKALLPVLLRCAGDVDPNIHRGDDIDIRHYIKLKKAAGGSPADTTYISGVVFSKNVALKSMPRHILHPRILLISFPIVYARHQQHFMSLEPVIAQEREYLRNLVGRIKALKPSILLVQRDVSGLALQFLSEAKIVVAYNVKSSVIQALSRCTQTRIVTSAERLNTSYNALGTCASFDVKTYVSQKVKRTFMSFSGCQRDLGCTVVLRGESMETLSRIKWITEFMCYVTYNLKLETCLMRDASAALLPAENPPSNASRPTDENLEMSISRPSTATEPLKPESSNGSPNKSEGVTESSSVVENTTLDEPAGPYDSLVRDLDGRYLSVSPYVQMAEPWILMRGRDCEQQMARIRKLQQGWKPTSSDDIDEKDTGVHKFELVKPESVRRAGSKASRLARDAQYAIYEAEHDRATYQYSNVKRMWDRFTGTTPDFFSPLSHQRIMVSFSIISTPTLDACDGPDLVGLDFYQEHDIEENLEPDVPLGEYIERLCNQAYSPCTANRCDKRMIDHHRQYIHDDAQVNVYLQKYPSRYKGMENTILMWSTCRKCQHETLVTPMSGNTWKYSFGKYLDLSFSATPLSPKSDLCSHDIHRDHIRYFGFKNLAVRVQYDTIKIVEISVPRAEVLWKVEKDLRLKNISYQRAEERLVRYMSSVRQRIKSINIATIAPEKLEECEKEIERLSEKANEESDLLLQKLQEEYMKSKYFELIPMNRAVRYMQEKVAEWDTAFADFEHDYFPSEKDIRRLAALQLKKVFLDRDDAESVNGDHEEKPDRKLSSPEDFVSEKKAAKTAADAESGDIPLETLPAPAIDTSSVIGSMPAESLFSPTTTTSLREHDQLVQTLDLALPSKLPITSPPNGELGVDGMAGSFVEARRPSIAPPPTPYPLEAEIVDRVEQMQVEAEAAIVEQNMARPVTPNLHTSHHNDEATTPEAAPPIMPPMLRAKTQPELSIWPDPDTPVRLSSSPDTTTHIPLPNFTSRIPVAPSTLLVDRMGLSAMRTGKGPLQSMIPRAVKKQESKVSALAKHFEEMSREFEKERLRERRQRAARNRISRAYPMIASRPIVEVFRDANEAVEERDVPEGHYRGPSMEEHMHDTDLDDDDPFQTRDSKDQATKQEIQEGAEDEASRVEAALPSKDLEDDQTVEDESSSSDDEDEDQPSVTDPRHSTDFSDKGAPSIFDVQQDYATELPKHEKTSLLKMLTSFWSERSASGWSPLEYPMASTDHIFADSDIIVREDEPSSLIAFALASDDYEMKLQRFRERAMTVDLVHAQQAGPTGEVPKTQEDINVERIMLGKTATHMKYQFQAGTARMLVKVFYAESFDAIRAKCGISHRFVESLSRSIKFDSKGGKTKSLFLKTLDERFILKSLSAIETQSFLKFAPDYFDYMSKCLFHNLPSALAKMLGFYQVVIKNPATGTDLNYFLQVMENVFYEGPQPSRMFDLKGSMRNRRIQATGEADEVLLDENLLDYISAHPIYVRAHSNSLLISSIQNDTLFCSKQNVMDYSLIAGLYDCAEKQELCVGIIDYIRTYTWDKKIESWIKDRGKHKPTVMSPKDYRARFRRSMPRYFPMVPGPWQSFGREVLGREEIRGEETVEEEDEPLEEGLLEREESEL